MNELVLIKKRRLLRITGYNGICHECNSPIDVNERMDLLILEETDNEILAFPIDIFECPHCRSRNKIIKIYKTLNVTKELVQSE